MDDCLAEIDQIVMSLKDESICKGSTHVLKSDIESM